MICEFKQMICPKDSGQAGSDSYMAALYRPCERIRDASGQTVEQVKAVGYCLPTTKKRRYDLKGHWSRNTKHGLQFEVEAYEEVILPSKEGIIAYLSSGQIKGVGRKTAEQIFAAFGLKTLEVLDQEPERLLAVSGISQRRLKGICDSYLANRAARDVVAFLAPYGITPGRAVRVYQEYGNQAMAMLKDHPYRLCGTAGIGFPLADKIAGSVGISTLSPERVDAGILYTLTMAEADGHLCLEKHGFLKECLKALDTPQLTAQMVAERADRMIGSGELSTYGDSVYRRKTAEAEEGLADAVCYQMRHRKQHSYENLDDEIRKEADGIHVKLAPEQEQAVRTALLEGLCVITGGPGTGKTMIQKILLNIYHRNHPKDEICCCAPTGRAARRMEQSTGFPAVTVHRALGLTAVGQEESGEPAVLKADLVLVDEVSMLDVFLALRLFDAAKGGCHMVLIGDADQLPSVGPGAVLSELIASGIIPVVRLDRVYRQDAAGRIAANARLIRHGQCRLEYGADFQFVASSDLDVSAKKIEELYRREISAYGIDHVALLTPYRQKTATGAAALNDRIREAINPAEPGKAEFALGRKKFRCGDKVMQVKNHGDVSNGDVGYISNIIRKDGETRISVDFGDGRIRDYGSGDLNMLELGYASTIHKSQGAEYQSVIISLQCAHSIMLARPLIYTAVTRAKSRVIIVGDRRALYTAIRRTDTKKRQTNLAQRIKERSGC